MTVKRVTGQQKDAVATIFRAGTKNITELAACLAVSARTIRRILVEKGAVPGKAKVTKEDERVRKTLAAWNIKPSELNGLLQQLEDFGYINIVDDKLRVGNPGYLNHEAAVNTMVHASLSMYEDMLCRIIHTREAIKYNISVQAAMLKLEQQTINAAKKTNEQQSTKQ